jgi:3'(2'), 5'-bisphosphate nucleotidase
MNLEFELKDDDLQYLINLADEAGQAIMEIYSKREEFQQTVKADQSPLTAADMTSNKVILKGLLSRWPNIPILSEESKNTFKQGEQPVMYWAVDPLDGTKEFVKGNGEFTVNVALIENGYPTVGVVSAPALNLMYLGVTATSSSLSCMAGKRIANRWEKIAVSGEIHSRLVNRSLRVVISRSHPSKQLETWLSSFEKVESRDIGSSLKFCLVADGTVDIYPRFGPTCIWDTAAGQAVVLAAGGVVKDLSDNFLTYPEPFNVLNPFFLAHGNSYS